MPDKVHRPPLIRFPVLRDRRQPANGTHRQIAENLLPVKVLLIEFGFFPFFFRDCHDALLNLDRLL
jgi:hypothetical protein